jgi:DNA-directed RNA polymerase II subunit RPB1
MYRELSYNNAITPVRSVQFALLSEDEIRRRSVVEVQTTQTFDGSDAQPNGLFDQRMGVVENGRVCMTCQQGYTFCPGHMGHVTLAVPVFHIHFFKIVVNIMKCVCFRCSRLLIAAEHPDMVALQRYQRQRRWEAVYRLISKSGAVK